MDVMGVHHMYVSALICQCWSATWQHNALQHASICIQQWEDTADMLERVLGIGLCFSIKVFGLCLSLSGGASATVYDSSLQSPALLYQQAGDLSLCVHAEH